MPEFSFFAFKTGIKSFSQSDLWKEFTANVVLPANVTTNIEI